MCGWVQRREIIDAFCIHSTTKQPVNLYTTISQYLDTYLDRRTDAVTKEQRGPFKLGRWVHDEPNQPALPFWGHGAVRRWGRGAGQSFSGLE